MSHRRRDPSAVVTLGLRAYHAFASRLTIPSRDAGLILFDHPFGTQLAMRKAIAAGWESDIHDFVILKGGRQIGGLAEHVQREHPEVRGRYIILRRDQRG